jgi:hypothetical protein
MVKLGERTQIRPIPELGIRFGSYVVMNIQRIA